ncbi:MAG: hypothetical protein WA990_08615 [Rubrobacteraceae bacterium]
MSMKKVIAGVLAATFLTLGGAMLEGGATMAAAQSPAQTTPQERQAPGGQGDENEAGENEAGENETGPQPQPLTGQTLERASRAALAATGGGEVTSANVGEEPGVAYDVDVALPDGSEFDVHLDRNYGVIEVLDDAVPDQALPDTGGVGILPVAGVAGIAVVIAGGLIARRVMR